MEAAKEGNFNSLVTIEKEIEESYISWKNALMNHQIQFIETFYADDFTSTTCAGIVKNKAEVLTRLGFKDIEYLSWEDKNILIDIKVENPVLKCRQILSIVLYGLSVKIEREIMLTFKKVNNKWSLKNIKENSV